MCETNRAISKLILFLSFPRHPLFPLIPAYNPAAAAAAAASFQSLLSAGLNHNQRAPISGACAPEYHSLLTSLAISATTTTSASGATGSPSSPSPTLTQKVGEEGDTKNEQDTKGVEEMDVDNKSATEAEGSFSVKVKTTSLPP